ncbi:hypothetical protein Mth01_33560 [Sphaerimonospora thailandensis]|uniref:Uncharacterized protein n=2 Tax=Sphaerimonospora thailandensis TaxID=795644 RepID=A0A8J3W0H5_9ACTN|nr:hypothetical protein Mth01_33560 [Sphaerimonospora thailandensis]
MDSHVTAVREDAAYDWDMSEASREIPLEEKRLAAVVPADQPDLVVRLRETIEVLSNSDAVQAVVESRASIARGEGLRSKDAIRGLLDGRQ